MYEEISYLEREIERLNEAVQEDAVYVYDLVAEKLRLEREYEDTDRVEGQIESAKQRIKSNNKKLEEFERRLEKLKIERDEEWEAERREKQAERRRREEEERREAEAEERRRREEVESRRKKEEEARRKKEEEARRKAEEEERKRREEEEARLKVAAAAKRKAQEEANRRQLAAMQAQQNPQATQTPKPTPQTATPSANGTAFCPHCGSSVSRTAKFCPSCGTRLLAVCPNCGANVKATSKFCTSCGTPIAAAATPASAPTATPASAVVDDHSALTRDIDDNGKWGLKNAGNSWAIAPQVDRVRDIPEDCKYGLAAMDIDGETLWGIIDRKGNFVLQPVFDNAYMSEDCEFAVECEKGGTQYFDFSDDDWLSETSEFAAFCAMMNGRSFDDEDNVDNNDNDDDYDDEDDNGNGNESRDLEDEVYWSAKSKNGKWGMVDGSGKWRIEPQYQKTTYFSDGVFLQFDCKVLYLCEFSKIQLMTAEYRFVLKSLLVLPALAMVLLLSSCRKESYYVYRLVSDVEVEATDESVVNLYGGFDDPYYKDQFIKGTITWQKEPISGDWVELSHLHNGRLIYYNVPASVCLMITPEEYEAAVNEDSESPYYNKALYNFLQTHNVAQLSDGSRPAKTALAQPADLWYIFIPAGLLLLCAMICHLSGVTSLLLPLFGAFCMLMQLVVLVALSIKGMYYEDGVVLFFYTFFPALLIMAANVYSGYRINKSIIDHYNMKIGTRTILEPLGIGAAVFIALSAVSGYVYQ